MKRTRALRGRRWQLVRRRVLERDGYRCRACGRPGRLEVHHVRALADGGAPYDLANLRALCRPCHLADHAAAEPADVAAWSRFMKG